ncbi:MAG TPA: hypothetical protein VKV80_21195 [Streptosporangiaceae bacterium]|nr:hypothetical protein [Streptosporangiaceae bacterium]
MALGGTRQQDGSLAAFAAVTAVIAVRSVPVTAPGIAVIAWMFDNGFIVSRHARLAWHGTADAIRLGVLSGAAIIGVLAGWYIRAHDTRPAAPPSPDDRDGQPVPGQRQGTVVNLAEVRDLCDRRDTAQDRDEAPPAAGYHDD